MEKKTETIAKETLEIVLEEFTKEQQTINQTVNDLISAVNELNGKFDSFQKKRSLTENNAVKIDIMPIQEIIKSGIVDMKLIVGSQPKSIIKKFQILLFPEQDAKLFYKVVFSRWLLWLVLLLFITNLYKWGIHWSEAQQTIKIKQLENERIQKAWDYLYKKNGKGVKRLMDEAISNSEQQ
ncbi:hypothetical protein [Solitalea lacus]|uniref:hypothetical protein n=1 Tax=Solitalea lacus TaxID=2911172 RepID=UPI001EDA2A90|nr:hypothetical protein [Solitalea lacus]UKJ07929.1 hypothetical protein L2B55_01895 [Solitalea lacus]